MAVRDKPVSWNPLTPLLRFVVVDLLYNLYIQQLTRFSLIWRVKKTQKIVRKLYETANRLHVAAIVDQQDRWTNGRTPGRYLNALTAYYAGKVEDVRTVRALELRYKQVIAPVRRDVMPRTPPMAVRLAAGLRPSADRSAVRTCLSCRQPACLYLGQLRA